MTAGTDDGNSKPNPRKRSLSRSPSRSPPRQRKRPGRSAFISRAAVDEVERRQKERERADAAAAAIQERGVQEVVRQHYNAVPERGREWRKTDSKIKGLRSFNNFVKSALIQKFGRSRSHEGAASPDSPEFGRGLRVLDVGCGKGGDLMKWQAAPARVDLYVGLDPADVSIKQARERYIAMQKGRNNPRHRRRRLFEAHFFVKDCFGEWLGDIELIRQVGIDPGVGPHQVPGQRRMDGGFDVVSMMFCMHYAFENEEKARGMLRNVAGALRKGGRFIGVIPNSDILSERVEQYHKALGHAASPPPLDDDDDDWDPEKPSEPEPPKPAPPSKAEEGDEEGEVKEKGFEWGNSIYRVRFPGETPKDGVFRPPFGWRYFFFLEEAVEEVPEYVVPWEAFRGLAQDYNLELEYRMPFAEVWDKEKNDPQLGPLSERMGVRGRDGGPLLVTPGEMEAAGFYHAFCFYKSQ